MMGNTPDSDFPIIKIMYRWKGDFWMFMHEAFQALALGQSSAGSQGGPAYGSSGGRAESTGRGRVHFTGLHFDPWGVALNQAGPRAGKRATGGEGKYRGVLGSLSHIVL